MDSRVMEELVSYSERSARIAKLLMGYIESTVTGERELMNLSGQCSYLLKRKLSEPGRDVVLRMKTDTSLRLHDSSIYDSFMAEYGDEVAVEDQAIWRLMKMKEWKRALEMIEGLEKNPMNQGIGRIAWTDQKIECARMMGDHDLTINLIMDEIRKTRGQERKYLDKLLSNASRDELPVLALETMDSCPGFEGKLEIAKALGDPDIFVSLFMDEAVSRKSVTSLDALYRLSLYGNMCKGADEDRLRSLYVSLLDDAVQEARNSGHYSTVAKSLCVLYHLGVEGRDKALSYASWIRENLSGRKGLIDQVKKYGLL